MTAPLDMEGAPAPPRSNGELVFAEPWESRAFGMAVALSEAAVFTWPQFQEALIARIARWESAPTERWNYYEHWLGALEDVLSDCSTVAADHVTARAIALAQRPTGHDRRRSDSGT
jgi:nitrile hydratase accessory protein